MVVIAAIHFNIVGLGLAGFPFVGCDVGGFVGAPDGKLCTRWLQAGVFFPSMHSP
ncbi:MAG: TIM-barrel domain-containing protein [Verrucomicrobiia bacterium]